MRIKKDSIYKNILKTARKEFIDKGYSGVSMRKIAKQAGVGLGNIYNYFKNKDEIFEEVLRPVIKVFDESLRDHNNEEYLNIDIFISKEYLKEQTQFFVDLIYKRRSELNILLSKSHGSSLEGFKEDYIEKYTSTGIEYLKLMKEKYPDLNTDISDFFVHTMSSGWMGMISELVMHNLDKNELELFIAEYLEFTTAGWEKIMRVK